MNKKRSQKSTLRVKLSRIPAVCTRVEPHPAEQKCRTPVWESLTHSGDRVRVDGDDAVVAAVLGESDELPVHHLEQVQNEAVGKRHVASDQKRVDPTPSWNISVTQVKCL